MSLRPEEWCGSCAKLDGCAITSVEMARARCKCAMFAAASGAQMEERSEMAELCGEQALHPAWRYLYGNGNEWGVLGPIGGGKDGK